MGWGEPAFLVFFEKWEWVEGMSERRGAPTPQFTDRPGTVCCRTIRPGCPHTCWILVPGDGGRGLGGEGAGAGGAVAAALSRKWAAGVGLWAGPRLALDPRSHRKRGVR